MVFLKNEESGFSVLNPHFIEILIVIYRIVSLVTVETAVIDVFAI